jgi:hypothetical protein
VPLYGCAAHPRSVAGEAGVAVGETLLDVVGQALQDVEVEALAPSMPAATATPIVARQRKMMRHRIGRPNPQSLCRWAVSPAT